MEGGAWTLSQTKLMLLPYFFSLIRRRLASFHSSSEQIVVFFRQRTRTPFPVRDYMYGLTLSQQLLFAQAVHLIAKDQDALTYGAKTGAQQNVVVVIGRSFVPTARLR